MKAMILAAGLGTRLRPVTNDRPKALVEINGRTLLEITVDRLKSLGVNEIIVNAHHHSEKIISFLQARKNFGIRIEISCEDDLLLDTGGGLNKAAWFFLEGNSQEPFLLHNVDVLSTIDLRQMLDAHQEKNALATLAVQERKSSRQLFFDENNLLVGRSINGVDTFCKTVSSAVGSAGTPACATSSSSEAHPAGESPSIRSESPPLATRHSPLPLAFSGIHVISPRLLPRITESGAFSIIDTYLRLASGGEKILAFRADQYYWRDLGRPEDLQQAARDLHGTDYV